MVLIIKGPVHDVFWSFIKSGTHLGTSLYFAFFFPPIFLSSNSFFLPIFLDILLITIYFAPQLLYDFIMFMNY